MSRASPSQTHRIRLPGRVRNLRSAPTGPARICVRCCGDCYEKRRVRALALGRTGGGILVTLEHFAASFIREGQRNIKEPATMFDSDKTENERLDRAGSMV